MLNSLWKSENIDRGAANIYLDKGFMDDLFGYLCPDEMPLNFMVSGLTDTEERYDLLQGMYNLFAGRYPIIILHGESDEELPEFEPFYGMTEIQVIDTIQKLAARLNYTVSPRLDRVIRAHIQILRELDVEISLSGFYYLDQYRDMGEFYDNVMKLPCGEQKSARIWADLGADDVSDNSQFDLFRAVIERLAYEAAKSGWNYQEGVADTNCLMVLEKGDVLSLPVDSASGSLLFTYLTAELKAAGRTEFILLLDGLKIDDDDFLSYLCMVGKNCHIGILSDNAVTLLGNNEECFFKVAGKMDCIILFKHGTAKTASVFSEVIGRCDCRKTETSRGYSRQTFRFLPHDRHEDVHYSSENRYRVMPEEILKLEPGQAIIFDTIEDRIVYFN